MHQYFKTALFTFVLALSLGGPAPAQNWDRDAVPAFRFVISPDTDFYGSDLDALFDTDLPSCVRACAADARCAAFTYNARSNACFPKSAVTQRSAYEGAISAVKVATPAPVMQRARDLAANLAFLRDKDMERAYFQAQELGLRHRAGEFDLQRLLEAARARAAAGDAAQAMGWTGAAVSVSDRGDLWADYAARLLSIRTDNSSRRRNYENRAASAAINAYLRGETGPARATALVTLAEALERQGRGRDAIPALRLALDEHAREDIAQALDSAVGKYGFRITDSSVESNSATPRICAEFSEPLAKAGVDYETYVQLPDPSFSVQAQDRQLCVDGVEHGARYRITFREGLPAASGETLIRDVELTHYVRDRDPSVRFPGRSYVLPRTADAALPIETVNLDTVDLRLRKVSDRNLLRAIQDGYFGRPLTRWQDEAFATDIAEEVWTGTASVGSELNRDMTTRLPMAEAISGQPAGIYALSARVPGADPYDDPGATQWFVLSDLGLGTMSGTDGLHVQVLGLSDAAPREGVRVTLVSRANAVLGSAVTDASGHALFDPGLTRGAGASAPALVLAETDGADLGFLSLTDPAFDLSDRGVEGRPPAGPVDVFVTTDRGAYRAGETVHATALTRDGRARAIEGLPLTALLFRPDGVEYGRFVSQGGSVGGHVFSMGIGQTAPRGTWRLELRTDPEAGPVASRQFLVEDFLPERIDFDLALPDGPLRPGASAPLRIEARYLFGAPGADLSIDGQVTVRPVDSLEAWPGFRFGRYDAGTRSLSSFFGGDRTDARGMATVDIDLPAPETDGRPMRATVIARLADGAARPVERRIEAPLQPAAPIIGIKPLFDEVVGDGEEAGFEVIALDPGLSPMPMRVRWTLNRVETRYQWYQLYGDWNWEPVTRRSRVATGEAELGAAPLTLSHPVDWGRHELVVERLDGAYASAATDFHAGWYVSADASATPDRLEVSLDRESYRPGDTARLRLVSRSPGTALISVLSNRVIARQSVQVDAGETVVPLEVGEDWGTGAYVTAAVVRPMDVAAGRNPARALGLAHATVEPVGRTLAVTIDAPQSTRPRRTQRVRIVVDGAAEGDEVWLTLAAVDLGILNLTGFESPDPQGHYFGQRRLGVEMRDVYGRLIDGMNGALGTVRSGGDAGRGMQMQSPPPTQDLMASFAGPVRAGPGGEAFVNIDLPAFNGTVRLMAVAWSATAVGQVERDMIVRDPVVVTASVPRFLAPGDSSRIRLDFVHASGPAGEMGLELTAKGAGISIGAGPERFVLEQGGKAGFDIPVQAVAVGDPTLELALTTPDGRTLTQSLRLPVRANDPVVSQTRRFALGAGDRFTFTGDVFAGMRPGTASAMLSAGPLARFDAPGVLAMLDRYPYGCTEQVTSAALPLLYLSAVAEATGLGSDPGLRQRVDDAIERVLTRQAGNGAFGLWRAESGDFWLDAYVTDFLGRARAERHAVPDQAFAMAMDNLRNRVNYAPDFDRGGEDVAYALMVLAREGAAAIGDLRYYADAKAEAFSTPLAAAQLGAALAFYGDQTRADRMFSRAADMIRDGSAEKPVWRADYGTAMRDAAGVLALATEAGSEVIQRAGFDTALSREAAEMSTQEAAWTLLAANALIRTPEQSGLRVDGSPVDGPFVRVIHNHTAITPVEITADSGRATDITLTVIGVPETPPGAGGTGYAIDRAYYDMDGGAIDRSAFKVGQRFVTVLTVTPYESGGARLMVNDPLPAGVEIDNPSLLRSGDVGALDWLDLSEAEHAEFRADRFLAAVDLKDGATVRLAYVARAVSPGTFHHPAASVEDMYRPQYRARTETGRVTVGTE